MLDKIWFNQDADLTGIISSLCAQLHNEGPVNSDILESLSIIKSLYPKKIEPFENDILFYMGLFYKTSEPKNFQQLVYQEFADTIKETTSCDFTPVQADAFYRIKENENFSFSAPTSTGKSYLFNHLLLNAEGDVVIVVPSRALLSEYIKKISAVVGKEVLVLPFIDIINRAKTKRNIFVITPERGDELFDKLDKLNIELIMFDETQLTEDHLRGLKFDSFVRRVDKKCPAAKKVFAHPFIANPEAQITKNKLQGTSSSVSYNQRSTGKIFLTRSNMGIYTYFSPYHDTSNGGLNYDGDPIADILGKGGTCLIFVSKESIYKSKIDDKIQQYIDYCEKITDVKALGYISQVKEFLGANKRKYSKIVDMMSYGIIIHHGSIPLRVRSIIEKFINDGFAKLCFATSTLIQGVNMPFDLVWIESFRFYGSKDEKALNLKNLIGRAGRTSDMSSSFNFGYVVINRTNKEKFIRRLAEQSMITDESFLDQEDLNENDDMADEVYAIRNDDFNTDFKMPNAQVERLKGSDVDTSIAFVLDKLFDNGEPITGKKYYDIPSVQRNKIKSAFHSIFVAHMKRKNLMSGERSVLSTAIPILLWVIQGKTFAEIVSLRYSYLSKREDRILLQKQLKEGKINSIVYRQKLHSLMVRQSTVAHSLPDKDYVKSNSLFKDIRTVDLPYDLVIYDTYDFMDKVLSLSLKTPMCAAFLLYYDKTKDDRALAMSNFISFGTNDPKEIWLKRYGFEQEDMEWLVPCVDNVNEDQITFNENINQYLDNEQKTSLLIRYV